MDIQDIFKKHGIVVPEDKADDFIKDFRSNYKSAAEHKKVKDALETANATIQSYSENDYEGKLSTLQTKYDTDIAAKQKEIDDLVFGEKLNKALAGIEFTSDRIKNSVISEIKSKDFKINEAGDLEGLNDYLKDLYSKEPEDFKQVDSGIHTWYGGSDDTSKKDNKSVEIFEYKLF